MSKYNVLSVGKPFIDENGKVLVKTCDDQIWSIAAVEEAVNRANKTEDEFVDYSLPETGVFA